MTRRRLTPRQRSTILAAHGGICALCGRPVGCRYDLDHHVPLGLLGPDTMEALRPVHVPCHRMKTAGDVRMIAKAKRMGRKHRGEIKPKRTIRSAGFRGWRRFDGSIVERRT